MSNVPYCRFRNTLADLRDCADALWDDIEDEGEQRARRNLIKLCRQVADEGEDLLEDERTK